MELITKIKEVGSEVVDVITSLIPSRTITINRKRGSSYTIVYKCKWLGTERVVEMTVKEAVHKGLNLLDL